MPAGTIFKNPPLSSGPSVKRRHHDTHHHTPASRRTGGQCRPRSIRPGSCSWPRSAGASCGETGSAAGRSRRRRPGHICLWGNMRGKSLVKRCTNVVKRCTNDVKRCTKDVKRCTNDVKRCYMHAYACLCLIYVCVLYVCVDLYMCYVYVSYSSYMYVCFF